MSDVPPSSNLNLFGASALTLLLAAGIAAVLLTNRRRSDRAILTTVVHLLGLDVAKLDSDGDGEISPYEVATYAARKVLGEDLLSALFAIRSQLKELDDRLDEVDASPDESRYPFALNAALLYDVWTDGKAGGEVRRAARLASGTSEDDGGDAEGDNGDGDGDGDVPIDDKALENALHWCRYASAAYGPTMLTLLGLTDELPPLTLDDDVALRWCVTHHCRPGVKCDEDVKLLELSDSAACAPCHFVAVDREKKRVVLCIRGTSNLEDAVTDLVCAAAPVPHLSWASKKAKAGAGGEKAAAASEEEEEARAHEGIARAGIAVLRSALPSMAAALEECGEEYGVTLTGHSLGAGTATMCALELLAARARGGGDDEVLPPFWGKGEDDDADAEAKLASALRAVASRDVDCWAYAPPPVFLGVPPPGADARIKVFVHRDDCVPTLSTLSVFRLLRLVDAVDDAKPTLTERLAYATDLCTEKAAGAVRNAIKDSIVAMGERGAPRGEHSGEVFPNLTLVGEVYSVDDDHKAGGSARDAAVADRSADGGDQKAPLEYSCSRRRAADYGHIPVSLSMVSDHLPHMYEQCLTGAVEALKKKMPRD